MAFPRLLSTLANKLDLLGLLPLTTGVSGTLPTANGGTNVSAAGASGNVLTSNGTNWMSSPLVVPSGVPSGAEMFWPTNTAPAGWLMEDGSSISRTTYADLFAVIGTTYGTASASTFNLPDSRGQFIRVWANGSTVDPDRGGRTAVTTAGRTMSAGDNVGTLQAQDVISHTHVVPGAFASVGSGSGGFAGVARNDNNIPTSAFGGSETRPVNTARMMIIKT